MYIIHPYQQQRLYVVLLKRLYHYNSLINDQRPTTTINYIQQLNQTYPIGEHFRKDYQLNKNEVTQIVTNKQHRRKRYIIHKNKK